MLPAAKLRERLETTPVAPAGHRVLRRRRQDASQSRRDSRRAWSKQLHTPVYWAATVRTMIAAGATRIVECGPGKVLTSLNRRIDKNRDLKMLALEDPQSSTSAGERPKDYAGP
jgi:[acyl-carrier-protein] S-malonyltransferase